MNNITLLFLLLIAIAAIFFALASKKRKINPVAHYLSRNIMTMNEADFFHRLISANSAGYVFPQVSMSALIEPKTKEQKARFSAFRRISQKRVDYAIYTEKLELLCVVELDDRTHNASRDAERDAMLASAGIKTIRWQSKKKPDIAEIRAQFEQLSSVRTAKMAA